MSPPHSIATQPQPTRRSNAAVEFSIVIPCLNEAETLAICIEKARRCLGDLNCDSEIIVADNGSTDGSQQIAINCGATVVNVDVKGYGSALMGGITAARGKYVIMGDGDDNHVLPAERVV
jgi:glycosyltransferase involved in cell wall biosynthesis